VNSDIIMCEKYCPLLRVADSEGWGSGLPPLALEIFLVDGHLWSAMRTVHYL